jgi:carboxypeptidase D
MHIRAGHNIVLAIVTYGLISSAGALAAVDNGPRLGPVTIVEVILPNRAALDELTEAGYNISNVRGDTATIYTTATELEQLAEAGYEYLEIGVDGQLPPPADKALGAYHNYAGLTAHLAEYAAAYPDICRLYTLGQSVQGRELWAMLITDDPNIEEDEPEFKYISTMHGDEPLGTEMCLYFIDMLLTTYDSNVRVAELVDNTAICIVPLMNPDGLEHWPYPSRYNANGHDLNRRFPAYPGNFTGTMFDGQPLGDGGRPTEVGHVMRWTAENSFVLSANLHAGALVVNYPYDNDGKGHVDSPAPDDLLFENISRRYSMHNVPMWNSPYFNNGITNGAAWYSISGGMQDWNYRYASCNEVTIELSNTKKPHASQIPNFWNKNRESMLSYAEAVHIGVRGIVTDRSTGRPVWAEVRIEHNSHPVFTDPNVGDYHRMLLPGTYDLIFYAPGYAQLLIENVTVTAGPATRLDVELVSVNRPVADAGDNQIAYARFDGIADVKLDGSGSYDADGDPLEYFWFIGDEQIATGVDPNVQLTVGVHSIELIVNDGFEDSEPNAVVITVIEPMEAEVHIVPRVINRNNRLKRIITIMRLPAGISKSDVADEPFVLYVGNFDTDGIEASWDRIIGRHNMTRVFALFDKAELMDIVSDNGSVELTVVGRLESGQYISGSNVVRVIRPRRRPVRRGRLYRRW